MSLQSLKADVEAGLADNESHFGTRYLVGRDYMLITFYYYCSCGFRHSMVYMTNFVFEVLLITICLNSYVYFVHLFCSLVFFKQLWLKLHDVLIAINHAFFFFSYWCLVAEYFLLWLVTLLGCGQLVRFGDIQTSLII